MIPEQTYRKVLQRPGYETMPIDQKPSEFKLEVPDLKTTMQQQLKIQQDPRHSIIGAFGNQRDKQVYNEAYNEYMNNNDAPRAGMWNSNFSTNAYALKQNAAHEYAMQKLKEDENPWTYSSSFNPRNPWYDWQNAELKYAGKLGEIGLGTAFFGPSLIENGLVGGLARIGGGYGGSFLGEKALGYLGEKQDQKYGTTWRKPAGEIAGGFIGWGYGAGALGKLADKGALEFARRTGKYLPEWLINTPIEVRWSNMRDRLAEWQDPEEIKSGLLRLPQRFGTGNFTHLKPVLIDTPLSSIEYGYASPTATRGTLKQLDNFIENDVFPRLQRAGHNVTYDKTTMPTLRQFDPAHNPMDKYLLNNDPIARNSQGMFHSPTNTVMTIDKPSEANYGLLAHEIPGHAVRYNINSSYKPVTPEVFTKVVYEQPLNKAEDQILLDWNNADQLYTPIEESLLKTSYEPFFRGGEAEGKLHDYGAVNTQLRALISQKNNYAVDSKLDPYIDNFQDVELLKMLLGQPYTRNGTIQILKDTTGLKYLDNLGDVELTNILSRHPELSKMLKRIKDTMKYVAGVSAVGIGMNNIPQKQ